MLPLFPHFGLLDYTCRPLSPWRYPPSFNTYASQPPLRARCARQLVTRAGALSSSASPDESIIPGVTPLAVAHRAVRLSSAVSASAVRTGFWTNEAHRRAESERFTWTRHLTARLRLYGFLRADPFVSARVVEQVRISAKCVNTASCIYIYIYICLVQQRVARCSTQGCKIYRKTERERETAQALDRALQWQRSLIRESNVQTRGAALAECLFARARSMQVVFEVVPSDKNMLIFLLLNHCQAAQMKMFVTDLSEVN